MTEILSPEEISRRAGELEGWEVSEDGKEIEKTYEFPDFKSALAFVNRVGDIAETEQHHPEIALGWGKVEIELSTHSAGGLTEKDFRLASKIDALGAEMVV
jgi:4a-hydroxytetrahydrobiopterin dehydratase